MVFKKWNHSSIGPLDARLVWYSDGNFILLACGTSPSFMIGLELLFYFYFTLQPGLSLWNKVCHFQFCHIWRFIANLATFDTIWQPKFSFWLLVLFGYFSFLGTLENLAKNWFKTSFGSFSLCFDVDILAFWKTFDVDILDFYKCLAVDLLGFSKIWLLFAHSFWQHWSLCNKGCHF